MSTYRSAQICLFPSFTRWGSQVADRSLESLRMAPLNMTSGRESVLVNGIVSTLLMTHHYVITLKENLHGGYYIYNIFFIFLEFLLHHLYLISNARG